MEVEALKAALDAAEERAEACNNKTRSRSAELTEARKAGLTRRSLCISTATHQCNMTKQVKLWRIWIDMDRYQSTSTLL